ncbi:NTE family protein [Thermanaeromonas toyohensis ToBE]|uniref:NTE family protein n=1 Tax=Thermanaeromonas toyohensis ToBE TaxID=698762 RepID=A0A1W1VZ79_9FIRM|nr:patatin-like phospholipase family protein [Thermanaeromonas toyohensis]SMB98669.1 NTE family protein [Thermanaeromonas toyohensis ToBE]
MRFGLALGGGGLKGVAHLGVLQVLVEHHLYPDLVVGTSAGSIAAALFCSGKISNLKALEELAQFVNSGKNFLKGWPSGLWEGKLLEQILRKTLGTLKFSELRIPMAAVACDLYSGSTVVYTSLTPPRPLPAGIVLGGNIAVWQAVRASISLPGLFSPVPIGPHLLVDGGVTSNVPADIARFLGTSVVIAVDLTTKQTPRSFTHVGEILWRSLEIMGSRLTTTTLALYADLVLSPLKDLKDPPSFWEVRRIKELVEAGITSTRTALPKIKELLGKHTL